MEKEGSFLVIVEITECGTREGNDLEEWEAADVGTEPLVAGRGWNPGMSGEAGLGQKPIWVISFGAGEKAESVGTDAGILGNSVRGGCESSILVDDQRQGHLLRKR